jgi:hypothetical protein
MRPGARITLIRSAAMTPFARGAVMSWKSVGWGLVAGVVGTAVA